MLRIACIGSRELSPEAISICKKLGRWIVECGHHIYSGNAYGADAAFAYGGNLVDTESVHLMLPWASYNRDQIVEGNQILTVEGLGVGAKAYYSGLGKKYHPRYDTLSQGAQKLHFRNGMILQPGKTLENPPNPFSVDVCFAYPKPGMNMGGTGQGIRIAKGEGIPCVLIGTLNQQELAQLCDKIAG